MIKKVIALLMVFCMLFAAGCKGDTENNSSADNQSGPSATEAPSELQLLYCANDTLNPYKTISKLNAELAYLLFDPLVKIDNDFEMVSVLADSITVQDKTYTVTLKKAEFSDKSKVTADDVVFSFNLARESDRFSYLFYEVESAVATDPKTVVFTLNNYDPYFAKLLTFPILKTGSDNLKNEDNVELVPIGSGKFVFSEDQSSLIPNTNHFGTKTTVSKINLINAPDNESMQHYVEVGATDIYYAEMLDDNIIRMSGKKTKVNLDNLIYLGINHNYAPLKSDELRYAISAAVSRDAIVNRCFYTNALVATGFFHPDWKEVSDYQTIGSSANLKISVENLEKIGYNSLNADGFLESKSGNVLELSLLVNKNSSTKLAAANLIKEQLGEAGIKINLNAVDEENYFRALNEGSFQLYVGEIKIAPNMDIRSLVIRGGKASFGMPALTVPSETPVTEEGQAEEQVPHFDAETSYISVVNGFYEGKNTAIDVASALLASMPVIPLIYRSSIVFYSNDIEDIGPVSDCDIFMSIDKYKIIK